MSVVMGCGSRLLGELSAGREEEDIFDRSQDVVEIGDQEEDEEVRNGR